MSFKFNANLPEPSLVALDGGLATSAAPTPRSRRSGGSGGSGVLDAEGNKVMEVLDFLKGVYRKVRRNRRTGALHLELAADGRERVFSGNDLGLVYLELAQEFGLTASKQLTTDAIEFLAVGNDFDPVAEWLTSLRNETPLPDDLWDDLGLRVWSNATPLVTTITQRFLIAQVARCLDPGCDVSWMPIACGSQGVGKSATWRLLAPMQDYYAELGQTLEQLEREPVLPFKASLNVLEECDRVISGKGSNIEGLKNLISIRKQTFRRLYAKDASTLPRDFVFAGTSNRFDFLTDVESRRFFPITLPDNHNLEASAKFIRTHHRNLWARAVAGLRAGGSLPLLQGRGRQRIWLCRQLPNRRPPGGGTGSLPGRSPQREVPRGGGGCDGHRQAVPKAGRHPADDGLAQAPRLATALHQ